ncbi:MAG: hypothetical protein GY849_02195 [Deltaproteobacteria bacterium]|nr:hypothetical protein [Deltaproteobacteria bacterium]
MKIHEFKQGNLYININDWICICDKIYSNKIKFYAAHDYKKNHSTIYNQEEIDIRQFKLYHKNSIEIEKAKSRYLKALQELGDDPEFRNIEDYEKWFLTQWDNNLLNTIRIASGIE